MSDLEEDWVLLLCTPEEYQAAITLGMLQSNDIRVMKFDQLDTAYRIDAISVYVHRDDFVKAKYLYDQSRKTT